ncbi:MAG: DUF4139 domain-containing protein, partial [Planctomycetes bacterium]|nr:DUF4139 domain-containing protein [Planctomycetota bacterium]
MTTRNTIMLNRTTPCIIALLALTLCAPLMAREELVTLPERDGVQLTIYREVDLTLVRDIRTLSFNKGDNEIQFSWANTLIDPTSIHFEPIKADAGLDIKSTSYPAESGEMLIWTITAKEAGKHQVAISYFTSGITWDASYHAVLNGTGDKMKLTGSVTVTNNSGEDYENAEIRLIIGSVNLVEDVRELARRNKWRELESAIEELKDDMDKGYPAPESAPGDGIRGGGAGFGGKVKKALEKPKEVGKESIGEYYMYKIEGTETVSNTWSKRLVSIKEATVTTSQVYYYKPKEFGSQLARVVEFKNNKESGLPGEPLPGGTVQVYSDEGEGRLSYIAGIGVKYVPPGEEGKWSLGADPEVTLEFKIMKERRANLLFQDNGNNRWLKGWDIVNDYRIE